MDERYDKRNTRNINNITSRLSDTDIRNNSISYQFGAAPEETEHGSHISLACQSGTDINHTIGNVTAVMLQFIVDRFPDGVFKTVMPSTKLAHRQLRHTPKQINSQPYPICVVNPRISLSGLDNRLAAGSYATSLWSPTSNRFMGSSEMEQLFLDKKKNIEWRGKINRLVVYFDFVLSFQSMSEQIQWASYLINSIPTDGGYFDVEAPLELAIPDGFLNETARYAGIDIHDENGYVGHFVDYLNMNSLFPISYRFSSGRNTEAYYAYYMTTLLCSIRDLSYNTVTKSNNIVETDCPITFTLRCEFNTIGMFDLAVPNPGPFRQLEVDSKIIIPIYTDTFNEQDLQLPFGWKVHSKPICKLDFGETDIFIGTRFDNALNVMIDYHIKNNIPVDLFFKVIIRENNRVLDPNCYKVDWETRTLVFTTVDYAKTYRLIMLENQLYINDMIKSIYNK